MARMKDHLLRLQEAQEQRAKRNADKKQKLLGIQSDRQLQTVPATLASRADKSRTLKL